MKIRIIKLRRLNRSQTRAVAAIVNCCNSHDGTHYGFPEDADGYYLLYEGGTLAAVLVLFLMGEHLNCRRIYELAAFTLPQYRRRAYFSKLIAAVSDKLSGQYVRYAVYDNEAAVNTLNARGARHSHDELMLELKLKLKCESVITDDEISFTSEQAQSEYAECYYRIDDSSQNAYIFGVQTYANYLRQGHAYRLLSNLYNKLKGLGVKTVSLQVSSENIPALRLYEKLGMKELERLSLYIEQL